MLTKQEAMDKFGQEFMALFEAMLKQGYDYDNVANVVMDSLDTLWEKHGDGEE